jgi:SAM-dependent methyltransferase
LSGAAESGTGYTLDNAWSEARRRLGLLAEAYDAHTFRQLEATGIRPGWRCLEVGGGGGSVTRWLCDRVGSSGRVVATDIDTRFLDEIEAENLTVLRNDLVTEPLPAGPYDLIHSRAVLMHLPGREQLAEKLAGALAAGGWLVLEDADTGASALLSGTALGDLMPALGGAIAKAGGDVTWARRLPRTLAGLGLADVTAEAFTPVQRGGDTPMGAFADLTISQLRPLLGAAGATDTEVDAALAQARDPQEWVALMCVSARGRRA